MILRKSPRWIFGWLVVLLMVLPMPAVADNGGDYYSREQLTQMLAPVALYPDALLSEVLMAATYPLEIVEADRWRKRYPTLGGENLDVALQDQDWDASVKGLCHVPTILSLMSEKLDETTNLGNAFLAQEDEVMQVIQDLRRRAYQQGNLRSDDKQKVIVKSDGTIVIEPADPQVVYVPYYDTRYVYGPWWYPDWPPWYWGPGGVAIGASIYFWPDYFFGFGYWSYFDWPRRTIIINYRHRPRFFHKNYDWRSHAGAWRHEPRHRRGVVYRDRPTAERFGQFRKRNRSFGREVRGFPERKRTTVNRQAGTGGFAHQRTTQAQSTGSASTSTTRTRIEERQRQERRSNAVSPRSERSRTTGERTAPRVERRAPRVERVPSPTMAPPARERETFRSREIYRQPESKTIFSGSGNGREETRSSIRGNSSWNSMRGARPQRGFSFGGHGRERGGGERGGERGRRR